MERPPEEQRPLSARELLIPTQHERDEEKQFPNSMKFIGEALISADPKEEEIELILDLHRFVRAHTIHNNPLRPERTW